jgi:flagellar protein FlbD
VIVLSKLNGEPIAVNERWIETVEELPDTTITLSSGNKFVVLEPLQAVLEQILAWQHRMRNLAGAGNETK